MSESDADVLIQRGTLERASGNLAEAESFFRAALRTLEHSSAPDDPAFIAPLSALGQLLIDQGSFDEADSLLTRALGLGETAGDDYNDELPILLLELSRLYMIQSAWDRAERPLSRLLAITDTRGADRPEVATVLASLAAVRHALGDYAAAEQLFRQALCIREKTLTPNHITIAATMESLAETCAARGHFAEAVSLCDRALSIREQTLGANDASVRVARTRIADLQLEAPDESRLRTPPRSARALESSPLAESRPNGGVSPLGAVLIPWGEQLRAVQAEIESTSPAVHYDRVPARTVRATRSFTAIAVTVGLVAMLSALGLGSRFRHRPDPNVFVEAEPLKPTIHLAAPRVAPVEVQTLASLAPLDTLTTGSSRAVATSVPSFIAQQPKRARAIAPPAPRRALLQAGQALSPPATPVADSAPARAAPPAVEKPPEARPRTEPVNAPTSPTRIGSAPQPQYPETLRDQQVEGEVVVQFVVDEHGLPDVSSLTVVRSPHVLLTNAVRVVLTQFRFEPARTAPPQSIPRPETVRYTFTFRAPRR